MPLSERENWLRTVRMTNPERIPYRIAITQSSWESLGQELEDIMLRHPRTWPNFRKGSVDWGAMKPNDFQDPERDYVDVWGSVWRTTVAGNTGTVVEPVLPDLSRLDEIDIPTIGNCNGGIHPVDWMDAAERVKRARANGGLAQGGLDHGYHMLRLEYIRGFENLMMDLVEEPPEFLRLVDIVHDLNKQAVQRWIDLGVEVVGLPEDLGSQTASIIGPTYFKKWVTPYHKELHAMAHDAGCLTTFHCDGAIMDVADQILEIGPDVFNPQDLANGVDNLRNVFKGRLCINLDFDRQKNLPFGTPKDIRDLLEYEVRTLGSPNGGLMVTVDGRGAIPPENLEALVSGLEEFSTFWFE